uniref:Uncharacterized protein n=1 Tax=Arundo donax TaxID=35708 RepID=A0A0A9RDH3_ARUDO
MAPAAQAPPLLRLLAR